MLVAIPIETSNEAFDAAEGEISIDDFQRCRAGERDALDHFVRKYERRVFALLSRALGMGQGIEDLAQEVFVRAYQGIHRFDPQGPARLSTWLLTITYRVIVDARRSAKAEFAEPLSDMLPVRDSSNPERLYWLRELDSALAKAAAALPTEQRDVFVLAEFHELQLQEISQITGARLATVKTRLFRARARLRELLSSVWEVTP